MSAKKNLGGGVLLELSHEISYLIWLLGLPNKIYAEIGKLSNLKIDTEDFANLILKFGNQISCSCNLDFLSKSYTRKLEFIAQKGNIYWDYKSNTIKEKFFLGNNKFSKNKKIKFKKNNTYFHSMKKFFLLCKNKKKKYRYF